MAANEKKKRKAKDVSDIYVPAPDALPTPSEKSRLFIQPKEAYGLDLWVHAGKEGLDVSHYQGAINWSAVRRADRNISYVYLKATEGAALVDDTYRTNLEQAKRSGFKVGSYHFYRPNVSLAEQIANIKGNINKEEQDLIPIIDVEVIGKVPHEKFLSDLKGFLKEVTIIFKRRPIVYTFHNFYNKYLTDELLEYKFMIARYREDEPVLNDGKKYVMWQYTSKGKISGVKGNIDRSKLMQGFSLGDILL